MALLELGPVVLACLLIGGFLLLLLLMNIVYKRLEEKLERLEGFEKKFEEHIERVNSARVSEMKQLHARIEALEEKIGVLLQPEGPHKELAKEKVRAHARK